MLVVENLHAKIEDPILKGINIKVEKGQVHAIMGPNGSGKSTLSKLVAGHPDYEITDGKIEFEGENIMELEPHERAVRGIFMGFQYPVEIPGVNNAEFLRAAYNAKQKHLGLEELDPLDFDDILSENMKLLKMDIKYKDRFLNEGFSGGEKKRNEILQMAILKPKLAILDETDSGLDIDALKIVANGINSLKGPDNAIILITHYQRLLNYIQPDFVHVLSAGQIIKSGDKSLALKLEEEGYDWLV